ncbi:Guanine nucleotide exchange factor LTE1 [Lachnellula cervina]|uniref:Guanine nucleotide exchange factor LTE1 n=1 Tax=Lachnellula cervina TaxID=1316786 RepID=A0A7D8UL78_9HELO|nr:Guanine nucleotide exchange factor LTE1 [Lachnellula cervina]
MEVEVENPAQASDPAHARTPEALRQRQRDRRSPRGRFVAKTTPSTNDVREVEASPRNGNGITLWPAPRSKTAGKPPPDLTRKKQLQEGLGLRQENSINRRARKEAEDGRADVASDGSSAGREGRQFAVANVGSNGQIFLRPTIRPANQRYPQPSFVFPVTPPSTAGIDALVSRTDGDDSQRDSLFTPTRSPSTPAAQTREQYFPQTKAPLRSRQKRTYSYSTIDEQHVPVQDSDVGAFKIVIERPGTGAVNPEPFIGIPTLEVPIPSYKLGTPRFSTRGTAFLRRSSYTTSVDMRSSVFSRTNSSPRDPRATQMLSRRHSDASPQPYFQARAHASPSDALGKSSTESPFISRRRSAIVPEMFDALTFKPACDHPSVVRYSINGGIRAATPARLVAEITSPTFVDYDLLSDFFLTFRSFLETTDLLYMLIARLKWALGRSDETGTVVRVRTFVAIRHWILNYFLDDYVIDYELRKSFCDLLNNFVGDLSQNLPSNKVPLKILGELKKCWRRVCALYWDGPEFDTELGPEVPIAPGGVAGSRNPTLDPNFWDPDGPPRLDGIIEPDFVKQEPSAAEDRNFFADVSRAGHMDSIIGPPVARKAQEEESSSEPPLSPTSLMSEDFVSCSFPPRTRVGANHQLGAHPVPASSIYESSSPVAMTPKALTGKRVRPNHAHKRSGSFSDSLRDRRGLDQPVQKVIYKSTELFLALPYAGSLVRGNLFPPGQAFVEAIAPSTPADTNHTTTLFPPTFAHQKAPSAMSGPGMKKLMGSVRRALSTRSGQITNPGASPTQGSFPHIPPLGVRGATINRLPGTAVVPQARPRNTGIRAPMRIDLLGAEVAEDFKKAVAEDAKAEAESREANQPSLDGSAEREMNVRYSTMAPDTTIDHLEPKRPGISRAPGSEMTSGSKSIVIVDDTLPLTPIMTGALPMRPSVDTFPDAFMSPSGGPTPPSTPPETLLGTPRRSSQLLGQHNKTRSLSFEGTPSLVVDSRPSADEERSPSRRPVDRLPPLTRRISYKPKRSISLRRYASYHSGFTRHKSERSFDATTLSEFDAVDRLSLAGPVPLPLPLRILRRRPGGDLRAVTNVGDLNSQPLRRPMSTGSLTTYSDSVRSSYLLGGDSSDYVDVANSDYEQSPSNAQTFSLGALAEASPKPRASLCSTHSSQPVMRPSFEKEAQMLAQIPDDVDDDGGVESALMKLEGKFEQRHSDISGDSFAPARQGSFGAGPLDVSTLTLDEEEHEEEKRKHRHEHVVEKSLSRTSSVVPTYQPQQSKVPEELKPSVYQPRRMSPAPMGLPPRSMESYNSIPLLERDLTDDGIDRKKRCDWSQRSILRGPSYDNLRNDEPTPESSHVNSFDFIDETDSMRRIHMGRTAPNHESIDQSFLDSDSDDRSDLSSELSLEVISRTEYTEHDSNSTNTFPPIRPGTVIKEIALPSHPLRHPPSPPMTLTQALQMSPETDNLPYAHMDQTNENRGLPPTPEFSPTGINSAADFIGEGLASPSMDPLRAHRIAEPSRKTSVHLPFTLAFDSQILAQQFTLIEKDALNEIDWKDLIEMRWKDTSTGSRSWVDFLRTCEPRGVEVVIARFNLMVKWAVSECVLTQDLEERVRCIIKYIHIAAHCRKYRNFATMTQLTVALTSKDISRLTKTWAHVPAADLKTLRELEHLITPTHNFNTLRAEMEGSGADQGCIPFVGIYTHDLLVNSERPSQMASTPTTEPLINFEKCRVDATVIKNLLRLLEASQLYRFLPIEGVTERCLWMAALSDEEIARYGEMIQK